jgi:hypothetical protein
MLCRFASRKGLIRSKPRSLIAASAVTAGYTERSDSVRIKVTGTAKHALAAPDLSGNIAVVTDGSSECKNLHLSCYTITQLSSSCGADACSISVSHLTHVVPSVHHRGYVSCYVSCNAGQPCAPSLCSLGCLSCYTLASYAN